ncbi:hypothetical protein [Brevibacillus brevis]|uniref:hypothetical protein n=1 Tax=Brevibacillus brevis TaxID=1393 RepID=UPI0016437A31|nr:hypothetical protein [Brevibacillus brevis]
MHQKRYSLEFKQYMDKTNKKKQGVLMIVGGALAIVGAGYGLLVQSLQKAFELILTAF